MVKRQETRTISLDGITLASLSDLVLKARAGTQVMDTIALCAVCGAVPWTDDLVRHQRAILRGATLDVLVCKDCW